MGQAQSMSSGGTGCDGCPGYPTGSGGGSRLLGGTYPVGAIGPDGGVTKPGSPDVLIPPYSGGAIFAIL